MLDKQIENIAMLRNGSIVFIVTIQPICFVDKKKGFIDVVIEGLLTPSIEYIKVKGGVPEKSKTMIA